METYLQTLYGVSEDVVRLDPWHRQIAPFVLKDAGGYVLVSFESRGIARHIRFYDGDEGARAYFLMREEASGEPMEGIAEWTAAAYWEVVDQAPKMTDWERKNAEDQDRSLVFRAKKAHRPPETLSKSDSNRILVFMRALRTILSRDSDKSLQKEGSLAQDIRLPSFDLTAEAFDKAGESTLRLFSKKKELAPALDEFTAARLRFMPPGESPYELYFFYLPVLSDDAGERAFMTTVFLVNLNDGIIEWSDVIAQDHDFRHRLVSGLFHHWLEQGQAPAAVLCAKHHLFEALSADFKQAGIPFEKINQSYVASELIETYMTSSRLKEAQYELLQMPSL